MEKREDSGTQSRAELEEFIVEQLGSGSSRKEVADSLVDQGMTEEEARQIVGKAFLTMKRSAPVASDEEISGGAMVPAILGGLIAAILGGAIWGGITIYTGSEIGYVALGVGALCGFGVVLLSGGKKGFPLQVIAAVTAVLGVLIGKYVSFYDALKTMVTEESGAEAAAVVSLFSPDTLLFFTDNIAAVASGYDALWIVLAIAAAWSIPKPSGLKS